MHEQVRIRLEEQLLALDRDISKLKTQAHYEQKRQHAMQKQQCRSPSPNGNRSLDEDLVHISVTPQVPVNYTTHQQQRSLATRNSSRAIPTRAPVHIPKAQKFALQNEPLFQKPSMLQAVTLHIAPESSGFRPVKKGTFAKNMMPQIEASLLAPLISYPQDNYTSISPTSNMNATSYPDATTSTTFPIIIAGHHQVDKALVHTPSLNDPLPSFKLLKNTFM